MITSWVNSMLGLRCYEKVWMTSEKQRKFETRRTEKKWNGNEKRGGRKEAKRWNVKRNENVTGIEAGEIEIVAEEVVPDLGVDRKIDEGALKEIRITADVDLDHEIVRIRTLNIKEILRSKL